MTITAKILTVVGLLFLFGSMTGMFVFIRETAPSASLLLLFFVTFVGGGILPVWAQNKKFPSKPFLLALTSSYLSFVLFGFARVARVTSSGDSLSFFILALLLGAASAILLSRSTEI